MGLQVLHVVDSLKPEAGSVAISLRGLFGALRQGGVESEVIVRETTGVGDDDGVRVTPIESFSKGQVRDADVVHLHGWDHRLAPLLAGGARKAGKPYVVSPIGTQARGPYERRSWKDRLRDWLSDNKLIRGAAIVAAVNEQEQRDLRERKVNGNVTLLPYGLSVAEYESSEDLEGHLPTPPEGRCLLLLGPIHPVEGLVPLLKAFGEIGPDADGWGVVMAGPTVGDWGKMLEAAMRRKGVTDRVLITAAADVASQRGWLARASVVGAAGLQTRCPVSVLQAVAAGVPVIASKWVVPPGLEGVLEVCSPNREELRAVLRKLLGLSDEERGKLAAEARTVGRSLFDWSVLGARYVQLYESVV